MRNNDSILDMITDAKQGVVKIKCTHLLKKKIKHNQQCIHFKEQILILTLKEQIQNISFSGYII